MTESDPYGDIEDRADHFLDDVEYDTELAKRMARDARRVTNGELSEEAYHERYRDQVSEEFDLEIPSYEELEHEEFSLGAQATSRRTVLAAAATAATVATAGFAGYLDATGETDLAGAAGDDEQASTVEAAEIPEASFGMVIDTEACIRCLQCVEACREENKTEEGTFWMYVNRYHREDREYEDETEAESLPVPCMHCDDAPCVRVCPNNSRIQHQDGRVLCNYDTCLGCKYCEVACPYHVNTFVTKGTADELQAEFEYEQVDEEGRTVAGPPHEGSCSKCTFCAHRRFDEELEGTTACSEACPADAIQFGDLDDPESDPNQYLEDVDEADTFKLHTDASNPNVIYVGDDPTGVRTQRVRGPTTHEDLGLEEPDQYGK